MTTEQQAFAKGVTSLMRLGGELFFVLWFVISGAIAIA